MSQPTIDFEEYDGGDPYIECDRLQALSERISRAQKRLMDRERLTRPRRLFHAKMRLGVENARLEICGGLPDDLRVGPYQPGKTYQGVVVRMSNARGSIQPDSKADLRGIALRIKVSETESHDLLLTNGPVSPARNGTEFVAFAEAITGGLLRLPFRVLFELGPGTSLRMFKNLTRYARAGIDSLATEHYWGRGAMRWGTGVRGRLKLSPAETIPSGGAVQKTDPDYLRIDLSRRLRAGDIVFDLLFQRFVDVARTPIENAAHLWDEEVSPPVRIARLIIPAQDIDSTSGRSIEQRVDAMAFNPWNTTDEFRPLGHINRARKAAYAASASHRQGLRFITELPPRNRLVLAVAQRVFPLLDKIIPWYRLPTPLSVLNLLIFRQILRAKNLYDTEDRDAPPVPVQPVAIPESARTGRTLDGSFNDLSVPHMGQEPPRNGSISDFEAVKGPGATFGRNVPLTTVKPWLATDAPDPITVSDELLERREFIPAVSLNLLAAAWIQFQVHDWVDHPRHLLSDPASGGQIKLSLPAGRKWQNTMGGADENLMRIADDIRKRSADPRLAGIPVFRNNNSPWWDAGQLYGDTLADVRRLREDGGRSAELRLEDGFLPQNPDPRFFGIDDTGFNQSWWLGLSLMHTLFAREHNAVVRELSRAYPAWDQERLFQTGRLVIAALIAKIHTVEWTPAIIATKAIDKALHTNWEGAPGDWLTRLGIWLFDEHALTGAPGSMPDHQAVPYSLTEEFVTVYRMHPLIPDDYLIVDAITGLPRQIDVIDPNTRGTTKTANPNFWQIQGTNTRNVMLQAGLANVAYSFGTAHPGAITLRNYPRHLRNVARNNGERVDLSVVDLVRDRTRGIPRYNAFRKLIHKPRVRDFSEITSNADWAACMKDLYRNVDSVDTMVGLLAEDRPRGFAFSDTAFRIFIVMASRRLQSDRFLTVDFRAEVYSPLGLDWVSRNGMKEVLARHCPQVADYLPRGKSAFAPWRTAQDRLDTRDESGAPAGRRCAR